MVSYQYTRRVDKSIFKSINLSRAAFCFCLYLKIFLLNKLEEGEGVSSD